MTDASDCFCVDIQHLPGDAEHAEICDNCTRRIEAETVDRVVERLRETAERYRSMAEGENPVSDGAKKFALIVATAFRNEADVFERGEWK